jgi:hypothetical protein
MRLLRLLPSVAVAALIGGGVAAAQSMNSGQPPERAPAAQQHAPAEKIAPPMKQSVRKAPETTGQGTASPDMQRDEPSAAPRASDKDKTSTPNGNVNASENNARADKSERRSTTGQGAAGAARLSAEQRTRISSIIRRNKVAPAHLNVSVAVGTRIPPSVHLYPLPVDVVDIYPEWRGYDYIMVGDEILVIDPDSYAIVAVIEA